MQDNDFNSFKLTGIIAVDAKVNDFNKCSVARFPISVGSRRKDKDGNHVNALQSIEYWRKDDQRAEEFAKLEKGACVTVSGYFRPETYNDQNGRACSTLKFVAEEATIVYTAEEMLAKKQEKQEKPKEKEA